MMSIKKKRRNKKNDDATTIPLRQQLKELIDIIGQREEQVYRDGYLDDICKILLQHID